MTKAKRTPPGMIAAYLLDLIDSGIWPNANVPAYWILHSIERHCRATPQQKEVTIVLSDVGVRQTRRYDGYPYTAIIAARPALERLRDQHFADDSPPVPSILSLIHI